MVNTVGIFCPPLQIVGGVVGAVGTVAAILIDSDSD